MPSPSASAPQPAPLARLVLRVIAGTVLFAVVLVAVQSGDTRIAGMMLTFPVLNGMSLMMTPRPQKREMAAAMLPVIALNGLLAHAFIAVVDQMGAAATVRAAPWLPWALVAAGMAVWLAGCLFLSRLGAAAQWRLLAVWLAASVLLAIWWWPGCQTTPSAAIPDPVTVLSRNAWRIGLFAATLGGLLALADVGGTRHGWLGRLGAFPILPLFSLAIIASAPGAIADRMADLRAPILIGLILAMALAWIYSGALERIEQRLRAGSWQRAGVSVTALIAGWIAVAAMMVAAVAAADRWSGCAM